MIAFIVIPLAVLGITALAGLTLDKEERPRLIQVLVFALLLRLVLFEAVMRRIAFFSHGVAGGDCQLYEAYGSIIARLWRFTHVHFVTEGEMPELGQAALPCNILALFEYVDGAPAPLAGVAVNAFLACWTCLLIYRFMRDNGAQSGIAYRVMLLVLFGPSFLYHTSDTYKDGINAFLVIASLINAVRLAQKFQPERLAFLAASLSLLWFVRRYMVFMCMAPLSLGFVGVGKASIQRRLAAALFLVAICTALVYTGTSGRFAGLATDTYARATSANSLDYNARLGHGEVVGSGVVTSSYAEALVYTVFAPFPWQAGSMGLQLGKIEALIFYWFIWIGWRNRRVLLTEHRAVLLMIATFIVPGTLAYASSFSNIGLIVRQRMPIVIAFAILAGIAYRRPVANSQARPWQPVTGLGSGGVRS